MSEQKFVSIPGFPQYTIAPNGVIKSVRTNRVLRPTTEKYPRVALYSAEKTKGHSMRLVHRMVALAFVENPDPKTKNIVNHKDGNTKNYSAENLEWVTLSENTRHAIDTGLCDTSNPKRQEIQCMDPDTNELIAIYPSPASASRDIGIDVEGIRRALVSEEVFAGLRWKLYEIVPEGKEEWKILESCDGIVPTIVYAVSSLGRVRNEHRERQMCLHDTVAGYKSVTLAVGNTKSKGVLVHRLVATVFLPTPEDSRNFDVDHINGNRNDNTVTNLQWLDKTAHARKTHAKKIAQIDMTGRVVAIHSSVNDAAKVAGCLSQQMSDSVRGLNTYCKGYIWKYATEDLIAAKVDIPVEERKVARAGYFQPVIQRKRTGSFVAEFETMKDAAFAVHGRRDAISKAARGVLKSYKGFLWEKKVKHIECPAINTDEEKSIMCNVENVQEFDMEAEHQCRWKWDIDDVYAQSEILIPMWEVEDVYAQPEMLTSVDDSLDAYLSSLLAE